MHDKYRFVNWFGTIYASGDRSSKANLGVPAAGLIAAYLQQIALAILIAAAAAAVAITYAFHTSYIA